jgi:hypothetical protein
VRSRSAAFAIAVAETGGNTTRFGFGEACRGHKTSRIVVTSIIAAHGNRAVPLMALAAPVVLLHIESSRRGLASGAIFTGVGLRIAASRTLVPLLMPAGLAQTWFGLGAVALLLLLSRGAAGRANSSPEIHRSSAPRSPRFDLFAPYVEYGLNAIGLVPHRIFLVDFVARGLGRGLVAGAQY